MLIRLLPDPHQPTVLFKLTFENLPDHLAYPLSWSNQLAALSCDDLEIPELMHVLDKAVGAQSILEEVTFDLVQNRIKCVFIDGEMEEWAFGTGLDQSRGQADSFHVPKEDESLRSDKLDVIRRLESVLADVNESAAEMDREKKREEEREKERLKLQEEEERGRELERQQQEEASTTTVQRSDSVGKKKHKKSKSLLMNLVSSLFPLSLNSPNSPISPRSPSSLPVSRSPSRSPSSSRSPSRAPSLRSIRSENAKSPMGSSSAPSTLSRASSISAVSQVTGGKKSSGWKKPKRRGRGRTLSTSSNAPPVPPSPNNGDENAIQHTPDASESSSVSADPTAKNREPSGEEHQQEDSRGLPVVVVVAVPPLPPLTPRGLRRRARSTLVDTFRMYVVPEVTRRIRCGTYFTSSVPMSPSVSTFPTPALTPTRATYPSHQGPTTAALSASSDFPVSSASSSTYNNSPSLSAPIPTIPLYHPNNIGGDSILYYVWVVGSMMKRVEARIGEVIREVREELERLEKGGVSHGVNMGSFSSSSSLNSLYHSALSAPTGTVTSVNSHNNTIFHEGIVGVASALPPATDDSQHSSESSSKESLTTGSGSAGSVESSRTSNDSDESDTDTDGSSLHTPTGTVFHDPFIANPSSPGPNPGQSSPFGIEESALPSEVYSPPDSKAAMTKSMTEGLASSTASSNGSSTSLNSPPTVSPPSSYPSITHLALENPSQETPTRAPSPIPSQPLSPQLTSLLSQHTQLTALYTHIHHLLILAHARVASASAEAGQREVVLEVRGRRRAWLNRSYMGLQNRLQATVVGVSPSSSSSSSNSNSNAIVLSRAGIAMATTSHTSPLGRHSWSSEEWDCDPFAYLEPPQMRYGRRPGALGTEKEPTSPGPLSPLSSGPTSPFLECYPNPFEGEGDSLDAGMSYGHGHKKQRSASETTLFPVSEEDEFESGSDTDPNDHQRRVKVDFGVSLYRHVDIDVDESSDEEDHGVVGEDEDELDDDIDALVDIELDVPEDRDDPFEQDLRYPLHSRGSSLTEKDGEVPSQASTSTTTTSVKSPTLLRNHDFTLAMDVMDVADSIDSVDALPPLAKDSMLGRKIALMAAAKANAKDMGLKA